MPPLEPDPSLTRIARAHADEMAELNYFSHGSPRSENATLSRRAANAGFYAKDLGENLALASASDPATRSVAGWLGSPGHRANLLSPEFTHVGFGTALFPDGRVVVAQEFALEPAVLERAILRPVARPQLELLLELSQEAEVAVFFSGTSNRPVTLGAGPQLLRIPLSRAPDLPVALRLGVRPVGSSGAFSFQAEATLVAEGWLPGEAAPAAQIRFVSAALNTPTGEGYTAQFVFAQAPRFALTAWQNGVRVPAELNGTTLFLELVDEGSPLQLGVPQADGRYRVLYGFQPQGTPLPTFEPTSD